MDVTTRVTGKPRELQGPLNHYLFHPLARRLAVLLVPTAVTPNMVSLVGAVMVMGAGVLYALVGGVAGVALGFALHLAWHVVDGADGDLARLSGRASPVGEIVDGVCDYAGHVVVYLLLAWTLSAAIGWWAWAAAVAAGASRIVQSVFAESQRRTYQWWAYGKPWLQVARQGGAAPDVGVANLYLAIWRRLTAETQKVNAIVASAEADAGERARIAEIAREVGRRTLPTLGWLGANPRTVALGLSMAAGSPLPFFLLEIGPLNALLLVAIVQQRRAGRRMAQLIARGRR